MRRHLPAEYKRDMEAKQRQMRRAHAAIKSALVLLDGVDNQSGRADVDQELERAKTSLRRSLDILG